MTSPVSPPRRRAAIARPLGLALMLCLAYACARPITRPPELDPTRGAHRAPTAATDVAACRAALRADHDARTGELDSTSIQILNWNIQKATHARALDDLGEYAADKDLVMLQEAPLLPSLIEATTSTDHWSFAPGYRTARATTGVLTLSTTAPLAHCSLTSYEPWLRTPKATDIAAYALSGTDDTLVVVNIHAIAFSLGLTEFREQLDQVRRVLRDHDGPIVLSGDFNTWHRRRLDTLTELAADVGAQPLAFDIDHRSRTFAHALDHIFTRGLHARAATTVAVRTSDHNPMWVELYL